MRIHSVETQEAQEERGREQTGARRCRKKERPSKEDASGNGRAEREKIHSKKLPDKAKGHDEAPSGISSNNARKKLADQQRADAEQPWQGGENGSASSGR